MARTRLSRGDAASTLASLDQIDAVDVDEAATDVLFSRLSRSGGGGLTDGTSARAMLLLRLAAEGACVSFGDAGAVDDGQEDAVVHVQPLRDLLPTVPTEFCPALSQLRREVEDGVVAEEALLELLPVAVLADHKHAPPRPAVIELGDVRRASGLDASVGSPLLNEALAFAAWSVLSLALAALPLTLAALGISGLWWWVFA